MSASATQGIHNNNNIAFQSCLNVIFEYQSISLLLTRMWANAQPDGRPAEHRWRPLFSAAKFS